MSLETMVELSLVRLGSDTRAARLFRDIAAKGLLPEAHLLERLFDALGLPQADRRPLAADVKVLARQALDRARDLKTTVLSVLDAGYPSLLKEIVDPPIALWVHGDAALLDWPAVALVGSRSATPSGLANARRFGKELGKAGLLVVSGLARGIDAAAHRGALDAGAPTIAVLGNGTDVVYPRDHQELSREVAATGALVSEFPPGTRSYPSHFPLRNRIISGLSSAVVVVEASDRSGSLITARMALEQGRDVLAVPGNIAAGCYRGCHALIKDGARLVETVEDILDEVGWAVSPGSTAGSGFSPLPINDLGLGIALGETFSVDDLASRTGRSAVDLIVELGKLEVAGKVARTAGGLFVRLD